MKFVISNTVVFLSSLVLANPAAWAAEAAASVASAAPAAPITIKVQDLSPRFLDFYAAAQRENAAPDRRWELWKEKYRFAAVPPTPEGQKIARDLLDKAWARYPMAMEKIKAGVAGMSPQPQAAMDTVAALLRADKPATVTLVAFVGGFEGNAYTAAANGQIMVAIPLESDADARARTMAHEFTHAAHIAMGSSSGGWIRTIGATVVGEGLATRVTEHLFPGRVAGIIEYSPGWLAAANQRRTEILRNLKPYLASDKSEDVMRFTMGKGASGLEREAYYAGWEVVGYWLKQGMSFADIARIPEKDMPARVAEAIDAILAPGGKP